MTEHSLWRFSRALHRAINERRYEDLEPLIDEDVDWAIYGPVDMFPFLGARRGKAAVLEVIRQIAEHFRVHRFDRESIMLGPDSAARNVRSASGATTRDREGGNGRDHERAHVARRNGESDKPAPSRDARVLHALGQAAATMAKTVVKRGSAKAAEC